MKRIRPPHITGRESVTELIDNAFTAYNAARLREACRLFTERILEPDVTVGFTLSGAMTPAGIGSSCIVPLIRKGMIDWIVSTGANLYHDIHHALDMELRPGGIYWDDYRMRKNNEVRIYDIILDMKTLLDTDEYIYEVIKHEEFRQPMGTARFHNLLGKYLHAREEELGTRGRSILAACWEAGVPVFTPSPGDSAIGLNVAARRLMGWELEFLPSEDVNESTAIVLWAKRTNKGKSAVVIAGGGACKNFILQTEPQLQEIFGIEERGHDYFIQFTDARPDTGGLSGATPSEALTWGKIDPDGLPHAVVCYTDSTIALPLFTAYALASHEGRPLKRLYDRREEMVEMLRKEAIAHGAPYTRE